MTSIKDTFYMHSQ